MFDSNQTDHSRWKALDLKGHLTQLQAERALASLEGLAGNGAYLSDLDDELVAAHHAYVGAAVTEIATLRAELSGPQVG
jgi:predicted regulator of Ras-like GTPase activity (Roadblock/LC7/MglB family)